MWIPVAKWKHKLFNPLALGGPLTSWDAEAAPNQQTTKLRVLLGLGGENRTCMNN